MEQDAKGLALHLMIDGAVTLPGLLRDRRTLLAMMARLPDVLGLTRIAAPLVVEAGAGGTKPATDAGLSGFALLAEGHLSIHTYPASGVVTVDLYAGQAGLDEAAVAAALAAEIGMDRWESRVLARGLSGDADSGAETGVVRRAG